MVEEVSIDPRFVVLERLFKITGISLSPVNESYLYVLYRNVVIVSAYLTLLTTFIGIVQNVTDIDYILGAARPGFVMINCIWMHLFVSLNMKRVRKLLDMIDGYIWSDLPLYDHEGSLTMAGWTLKIQNILWKVNFWNLGSHCLYLVLRGVSSGSYHPLFFDAWSPFNTDNILGYVVIILVQGFGSVMFGTTFFAVMGLYISTVAIACTQLQKIQSNLGNIKQKEEILLNAELVECIKHHQHVLSYMKVLEDTFNLVLLGPFMSVVAALCFTAYTVITIDGRSVEIIQVFLISCAMVFQVKTFCWFSTELATESAKIRDAAWHADWVGAPTSFQRSLMFTIAVSKEFTLTAAKIFPVSRHTFLMVMNETYTYLMLLLNFVNTPIESQTSFNEP